MKTIILHTATVDSSNLRLEAGSEVGVGNGKAQITPERAQDLIKRHMAVVGQKAAARRKPAAKKPAPAAKPALAKVDGAADSSPPAVAVTKAN